MPRGPAAVRAARLANLTVGSSGGTRPRRRPRYVAGLILEAGRHGCSCIGRRGVMSAEDWAPSDLPALSYIRVTPSTTDEAAREVERQRAQSALAAQRLRLRMANEFVAVGYSGDERQPPRPAPPTGPRSSPSGRSLRGDHPRPALGGPRVLGGHRPSPGRRAGRDCGRRRPHRPRSELTALQADDRRQRLTPWRRR